MKMYRKGSHCKHDLKVHLVCIPKYRKKILQGEVAMREWDFLKADCDGARINNNQRKKLRGTMCICF
jgi:REP element-mobilizing transposase RayT